MISNLKKYLIINSSSADKFLVTNGFEPQKKTVLNISREYKFSVDDNVITNCYREIYGHIQIVQNQLSQWKLCFSDDGLLLLLLKDVLDKRELSDIVNKGETKSCLFIKSGGICQFSGALHIAPSNFYINLYDQK